MGRLERCHSIADLRRLALRRLPWMMREFLEGGSDDEWSLRENRRAFSRYALIPRALTNVSHIDTSTTVLGQRVAWPVLLAPTGASRMYHAEGELGVARAAARTDTLYGLSLYSTVPLEAVASATTAPKMFQLFTGPGRERGLALLDRARAAGYGALCLTVDTAAPPNKERDYRTGLATGRFPARSVASAVAHPRWLYGLVRSGFPRLANLDVGVAEARDHQWREAAQLDWDLAKRLRDRWPGPFALKGVLRVEDARRAAAAGFDAIIVSNHGGRQLDGVPAPIELVADFVDAVGDELEVLVDSGFRRGTDVVKALALGARAVLVGRAYLYGLAAGGEAGVVRAIEILREELLRDLTLLGAASVASLDRSFVRRQDGTVRPG